MDSRETLRAGDLRRRAEGILASTGWRDLFTRRFGSCALTGSVRYDLMAWPDIDIHMPVDPAYRIEWAAMLADLNAGLERAGLRLHKAQMWDDYVDPHPLGAGLYWGIQFVEPDGTAWKSDIWGWEPQDYARRQDRDADLITQLATADRGLILRLKTQALARPDYYGPVVGSWHIYQAVLTGATSLDDVERWKAENPQW
jgi:hypothetical protein